MSFPGVSRHFRIRWVCCLTIIKASSSSLAWSSAAGGEAIALSAIQLALKGVVTEDSGAQIRYATTYCNGSSVHTIEFVDCMEQAKLQSICVPVLNLHLDDAAS